MPIHTYLLYHLLYIPIFFNHFSSAQDGTTYPFSGLGKATVLSVASQHADFTNTNSLQYPGTIASMNESDEEDEFLLYPKCRHCVLK